MALPPLKIKISADTKGVQTSLDQVEAAVDGADAATRKYNSTLANLARASKSGAISADQLAAATDEAKRNYRSAANAAAGLTGAQVTASRQTKVLGGAMQGGAMHTANLGAQFNDIGVMLAAGQSPLMLAVQQGTQINQVMAQMGGGKTALRGLAAGFMSVVNPMSLATIGIIAGGAALIQWGMSAVSAGEEADKLSEKLEELAENATKTQEELRAIRLGVTAEEVVLIDAIAEKTLEIGRLRDVMANGRRREQRNAQIDLEVAERERDALVQRLATLRDAAQEQEQLTDTVRETADAERLLGEQIEEAARKAAMLAYNLQIAKQEAMAAAEEFVKANEFSSRFAGEEAVMGQDVFTPGRGDPEPDGTPRRVGGGGGRGALTSLVDSLQTQRETIDEWYANSQELLQNASDAELQILGGKHEAMQRLEAEHQERMRGITEDGQMSAIETYNKYGSQILSGLGATGAQIAMINAAIGASQALASAEVPFFAKFAAVARVLSAGRALAKQAEAGGRGAASPSGGGSTASAPTVVSREVNVNLTGGDARSQGNIRDLIEQINEAVGDGASLNVRMA